MKRFFLLLCALCTALGRTTAQPALIPYPQQLETTGRYLVPLLNVKVRIDTTLSLPAEGYILETYRKGAKITARDEQGAIWARQTLRQLTDERGLVPSVRIVDWPAFAWRGFMHDTGRNFIPVEELKRQIRLLSQYKINLFHWHLTDYPAWRIESRRFPQLNDPQYQRPGRDEGKFYTYGEIRDVIDYARKHGILVVPEIDMPGHSTYFNSTFGFGMADPRGMRILEEALNEFFTEIPVSEAPYIHIGSDEVHIHAVGGQCGAGGGTHADGVGSGSAGDRRKHSAGVVGGFGLRGPQPDAGRADRRFVYGVPEQLRPDFVHAADAAARPVRPGAGRFDGFGGDSLPVERHEVAGFGGVDAE